ncbi:MAG: Snf7 family protein [Candidatus Thorarchaeota archaeon]|nr:MAG: Snf7 family protein [Candidatus Thorarchaeota archaeon]
MDSLRKAFSWGRKRPDVGEVSSQLRILAKQLERQRNKLEKEERDTKNRAVKARQAGQVDAFRTYATEMVRFRRFALSVDKSRLQILKILAHLNRAQTSAKTSRALEEVGKILGMLGDTSDAKKLVENVDEIARRLDEFEIEAEISGDALDMTMDVSSDDLATAMQELDVEAGLVEASAVAKPATESESLEEDIKQLERELGL